MSILNLRCTVFILGLVTGIFLGIGLLTFSSEAGNCLYKRDVHDAHGNDESHNHEHIKRNADTNLHSIMEETNKHEDHVHPAVPDQSVAEAKAAEAKAGAIHFRDEHRHEHDRDEVATKLYEKVRVLCWVMTSPENHKSKAVHILATWGKRCNKILFVSEKDDKTLPIIEINTKHGREHLTAKTMQAFQHLYEHHLNEADWFIKADDDTYVVVENLRYFLSNQNTSNPVIFGHHFKVIVKQGYLSGGGGYVLSREALRRFGNRPPDACRMDGGAEDAEFGHCMEKLGVKVGDSRDNLGRSRFHCFNPETHVHGGYPDWYLQYDKYGAKKGVDSISDYAVTFHYVSVEQLYNLEFYIYHLRPYGVLSGLQDLNNPPDDETTANSTLRTISPQTNLTKT